MNSITVSLAVLFVFSADDVVSGPEKGAKVPALKVFDATGLHKDKEVDYAADRKAKLTVYALIRADKFDRPMNRFLKGLDQAIKGLDQAIKKDLPEAYVVAVWLTDDLDKTKERLPIIQQSVQYENTALTCAKAENNGPKDWGINNDAHLTVVVAADGKVKATFGYLTVNETEVRAVVAAMKKK